MTSRTFAAIAAPSHSSAARFVPITEIAPFNCKRFCRHRFSRDPIYPSNPLILFVGGYDTPVETSCAPR